MDRGGPVGGNALDQALWRAPGATRWPGRSPAYRRLGLLPFDHERQLVGGRRAAPDGGRSLITKGAPEVVLGRCADVPPERGPCSERCSPRAPGSSPSRPRRCRGHGEPTAGDERDLRLAGFLTFVDRPKADAGASIAKLGRLGVAVKVITGDNGHRRGQGLRRHRARGRVGR